MIDLRARLASLVCAVFLIALSGCGDSNGDFVQVSSNGTGTTGTATNGNDNSGIVGREVDAQVTLPSGVSLDLTTLTLTSQLLDFPIQGDGASTFAVEEGGRVLTVAFDQNDEAILIGFLSDGQTEVSVESTVEATLYFALGTVLLPEGIREDFWQNARSLPGFADLVSQAENLFRNDINFFSSDAYATLIRDYMNATVPGGINPRLVVDGQVRSGLQLEEQPGDRAIVVNNLRRRAYAFVYKISSTNEAGQKTTLITDISRTNPAPVQEFAVAPTSAYDSVIGNLQGYAAGKGIEWFRTESAQANFALEPGEAEAEYAVRVIGPSAFANRLSDREEEVLERLELETFFIDLIYPLLLEAASQDTDLGKVFDGSGFRAGGTEVLFESFKNLLAGVPGVNDKIRKGEYGDAAQDLMEGIFNGTAASLFEPFYTEFANSLAEGANFDKDQTEKLLGRVGKFTSFIKFLDGFFKLNSYRELLAAPFQSQMVEEFRVVTTSNPVTLNPTQTVIIGGESETFEAIVQDGDVLLEPGEVFEYRWSTSGNVGELTDPLSQSGTSFTSSQAQVDYLTTQTITEDAVETFTVEVFTKRGASTTFVGKAEGTALVRPFGFEIRPVSALVEGGSTINLSLVRTDGVDPMASTVYDYRLDWETNGRYGRFGNSKNFTSTSSNSVGYTALETELESASETVDVSIYYRQKGSEEAYEFLDRVSRRVDISNDENVRIIFATRFTHTRERSPGTTQVRHAFNIPIFEDAISYRAEIVEWDWIFEFLGINRSWGLQNPPQPVVDGIYTWFPSGGTTTSTEQANETTVPLYDTGTGTARITITLDPNRDR